MRSKDEAGIFFMPLVCQLSWKFNCRLFNMKVRVMLYARDDLPTGILIPLKKINTDQYLFLI